ncbi:MAG TPA: hypothetical protein VI338_02780 [Nitrososphaera sp.]|nr:hypothetical protein [Nitrososphaera sp.]
MQGLYRRVPFRMNDPMTTSDPTGGDKVAYFGVINVNENARTIGSVDIWRSLLTKELFCEEKRLGILEIVDYIGMPRIDKEKKWAVAISRKRSGHLRWKLVKLIQDGKFNFTDADDKQIEVQVKDFSISDQEWWSFLVEKNVNRNVEVAVEPKK